MYHHKCKNMWYNILAKLKISARNDGDNMAQTRRYEFDGIVIDIPIHFDERSGIYIEKYPDFIENSIRTKSGYRVLFSGSDACLLAENETEKCLDCATCKYFKPAAKHTWFGYCTNKNSPINKNQSKGGQIK